MIKLQVIGNLGKDLVVNNVNGKTVINFSVAHTEKYRDAQGAQKERTTWVECAYWTDRTAVAPYLKKGTQVYVEGTPDVRTYQTNDGRQGAAVAAPDAAGQEEVYAQAQHPREEHVDAQLVNPAEGIQP